MGKTFFELVDDLGVSEMARRLRRSREYIRLVHAGDRSVSANLQQRLRDAFGAEFSADKTLDHHRTLRGKAPEAAPLGEAHDAA